MFNQEPPRPQELTNKVLEQIKEEVRRSPIIMSILENYIETLRSPGFEQAIKQGVVSFTMVKPNIGKGLYQQSAVPENKEEALIAKWIEEIRNKTFRGKGCDVVAPLSFVITPKRYEEFYAGNKARQIGMPANDFPPYVFGPKDESEQILWEKIKRVMLSGPTTPGIIIDLEGNAIKTWREIIGPSNPDANRDKPEYVGSWRSVNAGASSNTGFHGSGSEDEVKKETGWFADGMEEEIMDKAA
jgi:nucleoside diphosphate kinase